MFLILLLKAGFSEFFEITYLFCLRNQTHISQKQQIYLFQTDNTSTCFGLSRTIQLSNFLIWSMQLIRFIPFFQKEPFILSSIVEQTFNSQSKFFCHDILNQTHRHILQKNIQIKRYYFFSWIRIVRVRKLRTKKFKFSFSRNSNTKFNKTGGFSLLIKVGSENVLVVETLLMVELSICVPCFCVLTARSFQNLLLFVAQYSNL